MILRYATAADADFLFRLRNDPETRRASLHDAELSRDDHARWLARSLENAARFLFVAELVPGEETERSVPVGTGRFDVDAGGVGELSLIVAPEYRGRGIGRRIIAALVHEAAARGVSECAAVVRPDNPRSLAAFLAEGFEPGPGSETVWLSRKSR